MSKQMLWLVSFAFVALVPNIARAQLNDHDFNAKLAAARLAFVTAALKYADPDDDEQVTLVEQSKLLENYYDALAKAGKSEPEKEKVRQAHAGLLKLQWFHAADLDDDSVMTKTELELLVNVAPSPEISMWLDGIWTLADAEIEPLIDDFKLRIRKGVRAFNDDSIRKVRGEGKTKAEKLEDQSLPYRQKVVWGVLYKRYLQTLNSTFSSKQQDAGRRACAGYLRRIVETTGHETKTMWTEFQFDWDEDDRVVVYSATGTNRREVEGKAKDSGPTETWDGVPLVDGRAYKFTATVTDSSIRVEAGTFACKHIKLESGPWRWEEWVATSFISPAAKFERVLPARTTTCELIDYKSRR